MADSNRSALRLRRAAVDAIVTDANQVTMMLNAIVDLCVQATDGNISPDTLETALKAFAADGAQKLDRISVALGGNAVGGPYEFEGTASLKAEARSFGGCSNG
jgi:hypothetical protein